MSTQEIPTSDAFEIPEPDSGDAFFEHMVLLAAEDKFGIETSRNCRVMAAEHLVDLGHAEDLSVALQAVANREMEVREELVSGY